MKLLFKKFFHISSISMRFSKSLKLTLTRQIQHNSVLCFGHRVWIRKITKLLKQKLLRIPFEENVIKEVLVFL